MALELVTNVNVQEGLNELVDEAYSMRQNLDAIVETPVLEDGTELFSTFLDSKTMNLYGDVKQDSRHRFKIDHAFDLSKIINAGVNSDGSISIDEHTYKQSQGTEFIIISGKDIKGTTTEYAIRTDKYEKIREQLNKGRYEAKEIEKAGGFKINESLKPEEISTHDGWKELAVGKNNASEQDYEKASKFLEYEYLPKAQQNQCFPDGTGMNFLINAKENNYRVRSWYVRDSRDCSDADDRYDFDSSGHFLRLPDKSTKGDVPQITPNAIIDYLNNNQKPTDTHARNHALYEFAWSQSEIA
ncbi:MAG: hypothetical protein KAV87_09795, partial [Desulfobacteraceae bacterium]|nr:hypothetical protein [Desulfobacteraceae bacterium]